MKTRLLSAIVVGVALAARSRCSGSRSPLRQAGQNSGPGTGGGYGQRGGHGGFGGGMMGRGLMGTVTEIAADHYTIKTDAGEIYTVHFSANTRIVKQGAGMRGAPEAGVAARARAEAVECGRGGYGGGNPPQQIKAF